MTDTHTNFKLANDPKIEIIRVGREQQPVIAIDDLLRDPQAMVSYASDHVTLKNVTKGDNYYPGLRAPAPRDYALNLMRFLRPLITEHFELSTQVLKSARCAFSIATTKPSELTIAQRLPHFDTTNTGQIAGIHFLCSAKHGGTAFYRHKTTGFETITQDRYDPYFKALETDMKTHGPPDMQYMQSGTQIFEQTARIEAKMNRLFIFKSTMLHNGMVNSSAGLNPNPQKGRLTTTLFALFKQDGFKEEF